jgi:hypothetical protein
MSALLAVHRHGDASYYRERAIQEQVAAARATCERARAVHEELAVAYRFKAAMLSTQDDLGWEAGEPQALPEAGSIS